MTKVEKLNKLLDSKAQLDQLEMLKTSMEEAVASEFKHVDQ